MRTFRLPNVYFVAPVAPPPATVLPTWLLRHTTREARPPWAYLAAKRALDLSALALTAVVWLPLMALVALAIKLDDRRAPVLYRQRRNGKHGAQIEVLKFRTMVPNADRMLAELMAHNERTGHDFKMANDPRITKVGRVLRKLSLDELPQLLNIARGDMTLVGPRPHSVSIEHYTSWQLERYDVTPGLTGTWQIAGRGLPAFEDRVRLDIGYIERRCLRLDLEILVRSVPAVACGRGAS